MVLSCHSLPVRACSCVTVEKGCGVPKIEGDAVFLGTVISKQLGDGRNPNGTISSVVPSVVRFSVTEPYRGVSTKEIEVETTEGCCACGYPFEIGHAYLVYAFQHQGKLTTSICTATTPAILAAATIQQYRALRAGITPVSLLGMVTKVPQDARIEGRESYTPLADVRIRVRSSNGVEFVASSNVDGAYEFPSLPPDSYEIELLIPSGLTTRERSSQHPSKIKVEDGKTCVRNFGVYSDGRIAGRIVTPEGLPVPGFITVEPADPSERAAAIKRGGLPGFTTGSDGQFELNLLWPGRYRLRFAPSTDKRVDFRKMRYYPEVIELSEGQHVDNVVFVFRGPLP